VRLCPGPINLYALDENSGTFDIFKSLLLGSSTLSPQARQFQIVHDLF
jgi:hypothetical protein